jgi:hypothetical protein
MIEAIGWVNTESETQPDIPTSIPSFTVFHGIPWNSGTPIAIEFLTVIAVDQCSLSAPWHVRCDQKAPHKKTNSELEQVDSESMASTSLKTWKKDQAINIQQWKLLLSRLLQSDIERQGRWRVGRGDRFHKTNSSRAPTELLELKRNIK